jgi:large subunit ribosomal protein L20
VRPFGLTYSRFIDGIGKAGILVDRKVLSDLAIQEPAAFHAIVEKARAAIAA